ncbi:uncharacterized protein LOC105685845 [Athalia rosae]|uniref:uncharacterized protein LOC105685845 n=1 Tax=Athalia rosae TaxID=37344 RepID=UPI000A0EE6F5|nr:uncharacterized protein LOC105685845 [Athalia rosae]
MQDKTNNIGVFTISLLKANQKSPCGLVETLENDVSVLRIEARHGSRITSEFESKMEWFTQISSTLAGKLQSLWNLAELRPDENNEIKEFADKISVSWGLANKQVNEEYARIRVASRTLTGTPLATLLQKIRKQATTIKTSLQIGEVMYDQSYITKGFAICDEIMMLLKELEKCDEKVQQYLAICKMTPYLLELESAVDTYVNSNELLPVSQRISSNLSVFSVLARLLTGELLGNEPVNPNHVLISNAPRKPVFITKNVKRKMDIPALPAIKVPTKIPSTCHPSGETKPTAVISLNKQANFL